MRSIDRRVRKLENRFNSPENEAARSRLALLTARIRRYAEESGEPFQDPQECRVDIRQGPRTIIEILNQGLQWARKGHDEFSNQTPSPA